MILTFGRQAAPEPEESNSFLVLCFKPSESSGQSRVGVVTSQVTSCDWWIRNRHVSPQP